jgi:hypothetical protein
MGMPIRPRIEVMTPVPVRPTVVVPPAAKAAFDDALANDFQSRMQKAKYYSDLRSPSGYAAKMNILREEIRRSPMTWRVDSQLNGRFVGITHTSGWRFHLPQEAVADLGVLR